MCVIFYSQQYKKKIVPNSQWHFFVCYFLFMKYNIANKEPNNNKEDNLDSLTILSALLFKSNEISGSKGK